MDYILHQWLGGLSPVFMSRCCSCRAEKPPGAPGLAMEMAGFSVLGGPRIKSLVQMASQVLGGGVHDWVERTFLGGGKMHLGWRK